METSILLAKLMGPMLLVLGLFVAFNPAQMRRIGREFLDSDALIFISGVITLPVGLAIVVTHNVWVADWPVVITLFGWIAIAAGLARIALPATLKRIGETMLEKASLITVPGVLMAMLGGYLAMQGYLA
jgi:energy-converting hydrogenase Eha subunit A